jgi:hypothetical protein
MPDTERVKVTLNLPVALVRRAKHFAIDHDEDLQDVVTEALKQYLGRKGA